MEMTNLQETELCPPLVEGWFFAVWGGYAEPSALSVSLLKKTIVVRMTVLLPEQLN